MAFSVVQWDRRRVEVKNLGIIKALPNGRWAWPFAQMEHGDFFEVMPEDRSLEKIRNMAGTRGYQLGKSFRVAFNPENGAARVTCGGKRLERTNEAMKAKVVRARIAALYDVEAFDEAWERLRPGEEGFHAAPRRGYAGEEPFVAQIGNFAYEMRFEAEGFRYVRLAYDATVEDWLEAQRMLAD
jgi:hypothetical protein